MDSVDLHCHSTVSDGTLAPAEVVRRAAGNGVTMLALTDHDHLGGLDEARSTAVALGIRLVDGVEISANWNGITVHVVALGIDPSHGGLRAALAGVRVGRSVRAQRMAEDLGRIGIHGALQGALALVGNPELISRTHFARFLVQRGHAADVRGAFQHFLTDGKPGYVAHAWPELADVLAWVVAAGGVGVLAHPGRYRVGAAQLDRLVGDFAALGGTGIEVVCGSHEPHHARRAARLARKYGLAASRGSDFHAPGDDEAELGRLPPLPNDLQPIWHLLD